MLPGQGSAHPALDDEDGPGPESLSVTFMCLQGLIRSEDTNHRQSQSSEATGGPGDGWAGPPRLC